MDKQLAVDKKYKNLHNKAVDFYLKTLDKEPAEKYQMWKTLSVGVQSVINDIELEQDPVPVQDKETATYVMTLLGYTTEDGLTFINNTETGVTVQEVYLSSEDLISHVNKKVLSEEQYDMIESALREEQAQALGIQAAISL